MIDVKCPNTECPASFQAPDEYLGKSVRCKKCNTKFTIANSNGAPAKEKRTSVPTAVVPTVYESPSPIKEPPPGNEPPPEQNAKAVPKHLYLFLGLGAAGVFSCLAMICLVGIGFAWFGVGTRSPEKYGGIEISSTTVKASAVKFFSDKDAGFDYEFLSSEDEMQTTTELEKMSSTNPGEFDPDSLKKTVDAISGFFKELKSKHSLIPEKIVIIFGSGIFKKGIEDNKKFSEDQKKQMIEKNQSKLRSMVLAETGRPVEFVDAENELQIQVKSLVPEKHMDRAVLIDLGNSACRGACYDTKLGKYRFFRSKGLTKPVRDEAKKFGWEGGKSEADRILLIRLCKDLEKVHFRTPLVKELAGDLELGGRKRIELIGGAPWVTTTYKNPSGRINKHTKLLKKDIDDFYEDVRRVKGFPPFTPPNGLDEKLTKLLKSDSENMPRRISLDSLFAGTEMLKVLAEEMSFDDREVYFNNNGQKAIVLGFMTKLWEKGKK